MFGSALPEIVDCGASCLLILKSRQIENFLSNIVSSLGIVYFLATVTIVGTTWFRTEF